MSEIFSIVSGKGGVGKTFFSINLSHSLSLLNKRVLLIDMNLSTPNVSINLKLDSDNYNIHSYLSGKIDDPNLIIKKTKFGFDVIPGSLNIKDMIGLNPEKVYNLLDNFDKKYDYIILDSAAGVGYEALYSIKSSKNVIVITTIDRSSLVDAYRIIKLSEIVGVRVYGSVINKYKGEKGLDDIESFLGTIILGVIHEDNIVRECMNKGETIFSIDKDSRVRKDIIDITEKITGERLKVEEKKSFIRRLLRWI